LFSHAMDMCINELSKTMFAFGATYIGSISILRLRNTVTSKKVECG
jgi:hypothetical protein